MACSSTEATVLSMPIGMLNGGTGDVVTFYAQLNPLLSAQVGSDNVVQVWVKDDPTFSGLFSMSKGFLSYLLAGTPAPDGTTLLTPMLLLQPWVPDYRALSQAAAPGTSPPNQIAYGNADATEVATAITAELASNPRYASLTSSEQAQIQSDFLAGTTQLLVAAETLIGRGIVDTSHGGDRRLDLAFLDQDGAVLADPNIYFELWGSVGGPEVSTHPLQTLLGQTVAPAQMPVEGGLRMRISGKWTATDTITVDVGGQPATDIAVSSDGSLYLTAPPGPAGPANVTVTDTTTTTSSQVFGAAVTYTEDLASTVRAASISFAIALTEILAAVTVASTSGALTDNQKIAFSSTADAASLVTDNVVSARATAAGESLADPAVGAAWGNADDTLQALYAQIYDLYTP